MLSWLFGKKDQAATAEDSVWMSGAAKMTGICKEVDRLRKEGRSVVVVAPALPVFDELARELEQHKPVFCRDVFELDVLQAQLARAGSVAVALGSVLSTNVKPVTSVPVEILVCGRNNARAADDAIVRFADLIGPSARVAFHLALDDELLKDYIGTLKPLLARLDVPPDEAISSPMVTRAIAQAQSKKGS